MGRERRTITPGDLRAGRNDGWCPFPPEGQVSRGDGGGARSSLAPTHGGAALRSPPSAAPRAPPPPRGGRGAIRGALAFLVLLLALAAPALAVNPDEVLADPALEERARQLSKGLRCVVCQNQSIDDSEADLARDMRLVVRERLAAGDTDAAVRDYLVARYGEFVLLRPPLAAHTIILWATPALLLGAGALVLAARRRGPPAEPDRLSADEERALAAALGEGGADPRP